MPRGSASLEAILLLVVLNNYKSAIILIKRKGYKYNANVNLCNRVTSVI